MPTAETGERDRRRSVPFSLLRGGTSKCLVFDTDQVPGETREELTAFLLEVMGSPDVRQIDGLGGGTSLTSKVLLMDPSPRVFNGKDHAAFLFAQVGVDSATVDYGGTCGNCTAAAAVYAVERKILTVKGEEVSVPLFNLNTDSVIVAEMSLDEEGHPSTRGDEHVSGVPGTGSPIRLWFDNPVGATTGAAFPTGHRSQEVSLGHGLDRVKVSMVDVVNPVVFVAAASIGATGRESAEELLATPTILARMRTLREWGAVTLGLAKTFDEVAAQSPSVPKIAIVAPTDEANDLSALHILARTLSMGRPHAAFALSSSMCLAFAAHSPGTVVEQSLRMAQTKRSDTPGSPNPDTRRALIHHPSGVVEAVLDTGTDGYITRIGVTRTARTLAQGRLYLRAR